MGPPDTGPLPMSTIFGECVADTQCPGEGAFCRTSDEGWPQGSCSAPCADRGPCDDGIVFNHCIDVDGEGGDICEQRCLNAVDCGRPGYVCLAKGQIAAESGFCVGYCTSDDDCGGTSQCNVYSAACVPAGTVPTEGGHTGDPCANDDACLSGFCIEQADSTGTPSGWVGGTCVGNCILPPGYNNNTFFAQDALPTEQCPEGNVCFPNGDLSQREAGLCIQGCGGAGDCRPGYFCRQTFELPMGPKTFTNGVCFPIDCSTEMCPAGTTCREVRFSDGSTANRCG